MISYIFTTVDKKLKNSYLLNVTNVHVSAILSTL